MPLSYAMTATLWSVKNREYRSTSWLLKSFVYSDERNDKFRRYLNAALLAQRRVMNMRIFFLSLSRPGVETIGSIADPTYCR